LIGDIITYESYIVIINFSYNWNSNDNRYETGMEVLVDPPEELAWFYTNSTLKKIFGSDFLVGYNYVVGTLLIIISLLFLLAALGGQVSE